MTGPVEKRTHLALLAVAALVPATGSLVAIYLEIAHFVTFPLGKIAMVALPIIIWRRARLTRGELLAEAGLTGNRRGPGPVGLLSGAVVAGVVLAAWYGFFAGRIGTEAVRTKAASLGIVDYYLPFAAFVCLANSLLEEYFFRAFLLGRTRRLARSRHLLALSNGAVFGLHHVFVLAAVVDSPVTVAVLVLGTVLGGYHWSMLRLRGYSIVDCWISHLMADAAIMWIGWEAIWPVA